MLPIAKLGSIYGNMRSTS